MKQRFIIKRGNPLVKAAIKKVKEQEEKTISKVKKKAIQENIEISEIHRHLTLYAIREHIKQMIKDIDKNKYL